MAVIDWENPKDVIKALLILYRFQTDDEKMTLETHHQNGVGFNYADAPILSSIAVQIVVRRFITPTQLALVSKIIRKYSGQLSGFDSSPINAEGVTVIGKKEKNNGTLSTDGSRLFFLPNVYPSSHIKMCGNFFWRGKEVGWEGPLNVPTVLSVNETFQPITIGKSVYSFLEQEAKSIELSDTVESSILFPGQKRATASLLKGKRAMCALRPGLGKSASAIFAANELDRSEYDSVLVVCPLTLVQNWKNEIKKWIGEEAVIWHGGINTWSEYNRWVITNYDTVSRNLEEMKAQEFKVIILDESILLKSRPRTKKEDPTKLSSGIRTYSCKELCKSADYVWLLSGSPTSKYLDDMWSQLNILDDRRFSSYWSFAHEYCLIDKSSWGMKLVGNKPGAPEKLRANIADIYFTADESEFPKIPEWIFDDLEISMSKRQDELYFQMEDEFMMSLPDGDFILAPNILSQLTRLIQIASNPLLLEGVDDSNKWESVPGIMEYEQGPFILWTNFIRTAELMEARLSKKYRVSSLTGATPQSDRQKIVDSMQSGSLDVVIAHPGVGKFGLTLTAARTAIYLERSYNGDDYYQSLFRNRRISTVYPPHVIHLISSRFGGNYPTVDHVISKVLEGRKDNSIRITSGMIRDLLGGLHGR